VPGASGAGFEVRRGGGKAPAARAGSAPAPGGPCGAGTAAAAARASRRAPAPLGSRAGVPAGGGREPSGPRGAGTAAAAPARRGRRWGAVAAMLVGVLVAPAGCATVPQVAEERAAEDLLPDDSSVYFSVQVEPMRELLEELFLRFEVEEEDLPRLLDRSERFVAALEFPSENGVRGDGAGGSAGADGELQSEEGDGGAGEADAGPPREAAAADMPRLYAVATGSYPSRRLRAGLWLSRAWRRSTTERNGRSYVYYEERDGAGQLSVLSSRHVLFSNGAITTLLGTAGAGELGVAVTRGLESGVAESESAGEVPAGAGPQRASAETEGSEMTVAAGTAVEDYEAAVLPDSENGRRMLDRDAELSVAIPRPTERILAGLPQEARALQVQAIAVSVTSGSGAEAGSYELAGRVGLEDERTARLLNALLRFVLPVLIGERTPELEIDRDETTIVFSGVRLSGEQVMDLFDRFLGATAGVAG